MAKADYVTLSAHKLYGPKGVGAIIARNGALEKLQPILFGGGQEQGVRAGTVNLPGIVGLARVLEIAEETRPQAVERMCALRQAFIDRLGALVAFGINGDLEQCVPHALSIALHDVEGRDVLARLSSLGVTTVSACNSRSNQPSHVLNVIGLAPTLQRSTFRVSFGRLSGDDDPVVAAERIATAVKAVARPVRSLLAS